MTLTIEPAFTYWAASATQGLTAGVNDGLMQDPDIDGNVNLLEFVLGGAHARLFADDPADAGQNRKRLDLRLLPQ